MSAFPVGRLLTSAALAVGATFLVATPALAAPPGWVPNPGDNRATAHPGNVTTCQEAGLKGTTITSLGTHDNSDTYVTITSADIPAGDTLVAVVVKGGPGYNVYEGPSSWTGLHSPINPGKNIPTISHWFACVTTGKTGGGSTPPTRPSGSTAPSGSTGPSGTNGPSGANTPTGAGSTSTTTGVAAAAATTSNTAGTGSLPNTGFGNSWLIWVGALLLLAGCGFVALPRIARRRN